MPLPKDWKGIFWGNEVEGDKIVDLCPKDFIEFAAKAGDDPDVLGSGPFFVAGAIFDLMIHDSDQKRIVELTMLASEKWKKLPWMIISILKIFYIEMKKQKLDNDKVDTGIQNLISRFFGGDLLSYPK